MLVLFSAHALSTPPLVGLQAELLQWRHLLPLSQARYRGSPSGNLSNHFSFNFLVTTLINKREIN